MRDVAQHHPPAPFSKEEGEQEVQQLKAPSSLEEGVGGGGPNRQTLLKRAAEMRRNPTEPERRIWMQLRDRRFDRFKFRRQFVIEPWIVDFFCPAKGLVVEIDGHTHDPDRDQVRDAMIAHRTGFRVVRFANVDVMQNLDGVLVTLQLALEGQPDRWFGGRLHHPPAPSSEEEGEQVAQRFKAPSSLEGDQSHAPLIAVGDGGGLRHV